MSRPSLVDKVLGITGALEPFPHAFGGALALAYYAEPRATIDIDVNVFVGVDRFSEVAERLRDLGIVVSDPAIGEAVHRDGQVRVIWDTTPIDLFFSYDPFHDAAESGRREVPFTDTTIPVLSAEHLIVCKVIYNRPKDWVDIEAMLALSMGVDASEILRWVMRLAGDEDPRFERIAAILTRRSTS